MSAVPVVAPASYRPMLGEFVAQPAPAQPRPVRRVRDAHKGPRPEGVGRPNTYAPRPTGRLVGICQRCGNALTDRNSKQPVNGNYAHVNCPAA